MHCLDLIPPSMTECHINSPGFKYGRLIILKSLSLGTVAPFYTSLGHCGEENESKSRSASLKANLCDGCFTGEATDGITDAS